MVKKNKKEASPPATKSNRILFFDIVRILSVFLIVIHHLPGLNAGWLTSFIYNNGRLLTYDITAGPLGVYLLVFVSGAVLQLAYGAKGKLPYFAFILKRLKRIYPAYWAALFVCLLLAPVFILHGKKFVLQALGFLPNAGLYAWWIGLFVSLYLLFPLLARLIKKYPVQLIVVAGVITVVSRLLLENTIITFENGLVFGNGYRIVVTSLLFEFVLGMFIVEKGWYPKRINNSPFLRWCADISYYVFLTHTILREFMFGQAAAQLIWTPRNFVFYSAAVLLFSTFIMQFDNHIQKPLSAIESRIRQFIEKYRPQRDNRI